MTHFSAESILLPLQQLQQHHDEVAHKDILSLNLHTRLKHMVLHFYKYAGKIEAAHGDADQEALRDTLLDSFIICMASANALNVSLGDRIQKPSESNDLDGLARALAKNLHTSDLFSESLRQFVLIGGRMAKAVESADHLEKGDPRSAMEDLVPELAMFILAALGKTPGGLEKDIRARFSGIEGRSIFRRSAAP